MITVTFVRHGESMDNLRAVWAGWADAPLSNHGMNQARACGVSFSTTRFTHIYASPLERAFSTAQAILDAQPEPKGLFTVSPDVREMHFGIAEGNPGPWSEADHKDLTREQLCERGIFPFLLDRDDRFPEGESMNDLQARAELAINDIVLPYVKEEAFSGEDIHIAIVSHGLCISELVSALMRLDHFKAGGGDWTGLLNTAWTRVALDAVANGNVGTHIPLEVRVTHVNEHPHLLSMKRQGEGAEASDEVTDLPEADTEL